MRCISTHGLCGFLFSLVLASCDNDYATRKNNTQAQSVVKQDSISGDEKNTMDNVTNPQSRFTLNSCDKLQSNGAGKEVIIGEFLTDFPKELFDEKAVETMILSEADITHITANLACAAALSGYGPDAPESALALFASKRHGASVLAALTRQASGTGGSGEAASAARQFLGQMKSYLEGPGE